MTAESGAIESALRDLARESGTMLAELGVRLTDEKWLREHARTIASLKLREGSALRSLWKRFLRR